MFLSKLARAVFGVSPSQLTSAISEELHEGAVFERLVFPLQSLQKVHVIQFLKRKHGERTIAGLGSDSCEIKAYQKAIYEYFERKAVLSAGKELGFDSTNGVAAHRYVRLAAKAAFNELVERDAFLRHWYSATNFTSIDYLNSPLKSVVERELNEQGYNLRLRETFLGLKPTRAAFIVKRETGGFVLGLSSGRGQVKDIDKAVVEAAISLYFGNEGYSDQELIDDVRRYGIQVLRDHRAYWLLLNKLPDWIKQPTDLSLSGRKRIRCETNEVVISRKPVPVVGIRSDRLLTLSFGLAKEQDIDILRRDGLYSDQFSRLPHPIP